MPSGLPLVVPSRQLLEPGCVIRTMAMIHVRCRMKYIRIENVYKEVVCEYKINGV